MDNALLYGFDGELGGLYEAGPAFYDATGYIKVWWAQAEMLHALLLMHARFGAEDLRYWTAFTRTWEFISRHQLDAKNGGWHALVWTDDRPILGPKGHSWKATYHTGRALLNASEILRRLGKEELPKLRV